MDGDVIVDAACGGVAAADSPDWLSFLKNGFFVSLLYDDVGSEGAADEGAGGSETSLDCVWDGGDDIVWLALLLIGEAAAGASSSEEESSSPRLSSCR